MALFKVKAATPEGKVVVRRLEAPTRRDLVEMLERDGLFLLEATGGAVGLGSIFSSGKSSVKSAELLVFNKGLVALLKAGIPVTSALDALAERTENAVFSRAIEDVLEGVKTGMPLDLAMARQPNIFQAMYTSVLAAVEKTGMIVPAVESYIEYQKRSEEIRKKVVSAAVYPVMLAVVGLGVITFLIAYVVPTFASIYIDMGQELPLPTRALMLVTDFIKANLLVLTGLGAVTLVAVNSLLRSSAGSAFLDRLKLSVPVFGEVYREYAIGRFSRTLSMVISSGLTLIESMELTMDVLNNSVLEGKLRRIISRAREGDTVTSAMEDEEFMPSMSLKMFAVGEEAASLPELLEDIADFHDDEVGYKVKIITDLIEPAMMILMGLLIGAIVIVLYLPVFMLGESL